MPKIPRLRFTTWLIIALLAAVPLTVAWVGLPSYLVGVTDDPASLGLFSVPQESERQRAIGPTDELSPMLQRAFDQQHDFQPIPAPGPSDWLAERLEPGQTFEQYVQAQPHRPDVTRNRFYILPLGEFDPNREPALADLQTCAEAFFLLEVKVLPTVSLEDLELTNRINRHSGKRQYLTGDLLELLKQRLPEDAYCMIGLTMEDLYPMEDWNFVFGMASLVDRVGVFSLVRNDPTFSGEPRTAADAPLILRRGVHMLCHETGHMFGMQHCIFFSCVMNGSNHLTEADSQPLHLCPVCLRKLHHSRGEPEFVLRRYEQLEEAYRQVGLDDEAEWVAKRRERILDE